MAHNNIEIEIKVKIEQTESLVKFLEKHAVFQSENRQLDEYFTPAHRNFIEAKPVKEWLRLRESDGKFSVNYKDWHFDAKGRSSYCDEIETSVGDVEQLRKIFSALNFISMTKVDEIRKTWIYEDYEISIDSVAGLGDFVEVEYIGTDAKIDPEKVLSGMVDFLKGIGCGKIVRDYVGYPFLLLFPDDVIEEEV